jgi:D-3-phosphoglycerate dehydrogenase / 2-oxoglutarate reductase
VPSSLAIEYQGQLADYDTRILTLSALKGLLGAGSDEPVSYVNAPQLAEERGIDVRETTSTHAHDYVNLISLRGGDHALAGTLAGLRAEPRIVMLDDHAMEVPPARQMLVVRNDDRPGMIAIVSTALAERGINISDFHVGRSPAGEAALMVLALDEPPTAELLEQLRAAPGIRQVSVLT